MSTEGKTATQLKVVSAGDGDEAMLGPGVGVVFKIAGADTGGAVAVVEHPFDVGALVPPHVHTREDEISIVLETPSKVSLVTSTRSGALVASGSIATVSPWSINAAG